MDAKQENINNPSEWNDEAEQAASETYDKASKKAAASKQAREEIFNNAYHELLRATSAYRHDPTQRAAFLKAKSVFDNMKNYDTYLEKFNEYMDAKQNNINDPSEYNDEAEQAASKAFDKASQNAQATLDTVKTVENAQTAYNKAHDALTEAQNTLTEAQQNLKAAQHQVIVARNNYKKAATDVKTAKANVADAQTAFDEARNAETKADKA